MLCVGRTVGEKQNQHFQLSFWSVFEKKLISKVLASVRDDTSPDPATADTDGIV
jgi:hypothetical protein